MTYQFEYESNQLALRWNLQHCVKVQVDLRCVLDIENGRKGLHWWKPYSIVTESGQGVLADFMLFDELFSELQKEVLRREEAIITQYEALTA